MKPNQFFCLLQHVLFSGGLDELGVEPEDFILGELLLHGCEALEGLLAAHQDVAHLLLVEGGVKSLVLQHVPICNKNAML